MQQQFEALAQHIMIKGKVAYGLAHNPGERLQILKNMKAELFELKSCYEGLVQMPTEKFDSYFQLS